MGGSYLASDRERHPRDPAEVVRGDARYGHNGRRAAKFCADLGVGDRVWTSEHVRAWTVQARSWRYVVMTKPFNARRTVIYTVVDLELGIQGTDDYYGLGYETREQCEKALEWLHDWDRHAEISVRHNQSIDVVAKQRPGGDRVEL